MPLIALCLWVVAAWVAMVTLPGRRSWPAAGVLAVAGAPILVWLATASPWLGALGLLVMALILRWPLRRLGRWLRVRVAGG